MRVSDGRRAPWRRAYCAALLFAAGIADTAAGELALGAAYSIQRDDNVTRVQNNPIADTLQTGVVGFAYNQDTDDLKARLVAQASRRVYDQKTYPNENAYYANGAAIWVISPPRLLWTVEDVASQVLLDVTAPDTPTNRTNANSLNTGPDFNYRLGADTVVLAARYGRFDVQGPGDSYRYAGYARWLHPTSPLSTISLNYETTRVYYQPPALYTGVLRQDTFGRYQLRSAVDEITLDLGVTRDAAEGGKDVTGRLFGLTLVHRLTPVSAIHLTLLDRISDTYSYLLGGVTTATPPTDPTAGITSPAPNVLTGDVYRRRSADLVLATRGTLFGSTVQAYAQSTDYQQIPQDYDEWGGRFSLTWFYSVDLQIRAQAEYVRRTFRSFEREDTDRNENVGAFYLLNRNFSIAALVERLERVTTEPLSNFVDLRATLFLVYSSNMRLYSPGYRRN
jgi:predicted porin